MTLNRGSIPDILILFIALTICIVSLSLSRLSPKENTRFCLDSDSSEDTKKDMRICGAGFREDSILNLDMGL